MALLLMKGVLAVVHHGTGLGKVSLLLMGVRVVVRGQLLSVVLVVLVLLMQGLMGS